MRPWVIAPKEATKLGIVAARSVNSRVPKPNPKAPQALALAISKRAMPALSSRWKATSCPPASSTATATGAKAKRRASCSAPSMIKRACANFSAAIECPSQD